MKSLKQTKILFGFELSMMDKAIEMQHAKNEFQDLKNEELRMKNKEKEFSFGVEFPKYEEMFSSDFDKQVSVSKDLKPTAKKEEKIDEKLKETVENDQLFKLFDDIFNPNKNKEIIDEIMKDKRFPSGGILVGIGKKRPNGEKDDYDCPACVLRRTLEGKERGFNY